MAVHAGALTVGGLVGFVALFTVLLWPILSLGFLFAFASAPLYAVYSASASAWGLTPIQDQQLAGVIMWLPTGLIYLVAAGGLFLQWLQATERATQRVEGRGTVDTDAALAASGETT